MSRRLPSMDRLYPKKRDPDGRPLCRYCGGPVPSGRQWWCSEECVQNAKLDCWPSEASKVVKKRDHGVCSECGMDTKRVEREVDKAINELKKKSGGQLGSQAAWHRFVIQNDLRLGRRLWEVHHRVELINGGSNRPDNLVTLCRWCHKAETARLKKELEDRRRKL